MGLLVEQRRRARGLEGHVLDVDLFDAELRAVLGRRGGAIADGLVGHVVTPGIRRKWRGKEPIMARSARAAGPRCPGTAIVAGHAPGQRQERKSTRMNLSHYCAPQKPTYASTKNKTLRGKNSNYYHFADI